MDLSKVDDFLPHDLMAAKLEAYRLPKESLQLISDYLSYCKQRTKVDSAYSDKALYWPLYFSIYSLMSFFLLLESQTFVILQIITLCSHMVATFP